jgi:hypothetical protein
MKPMKISSFRPVLLMLSATVMIALGRAADSPAALTPHSTPRSLPAALTSYPPGTVKHPADKDVILRRMRPDGSEQADITAFNGGQGTITVNSWSPDSKRFAFVMYPKIGEPPRQP